MPCLTPRSQTLHPRGIKLVGPAADNLITRASSGDSDTGSGASLHVVPIFDEKEVYDLPDDITGIMSIICQCFSFESRSWEFFIVKSQTTIMALFYINLRRYTVTQ